MSELGWLLVIICGSIMAILAICGTAEELGGEINAMTLLFSTVMWVVGLGLLGGLLYGLELIGAS